MRFVQQRASLYVCQVPGIQYPNHATLTRVVGWVHAESGETGMLCSYDDDGHGRIHAMIPFDPEKICSLGRTAELSHAF